MRSLRQWLRRQARPVRTRRPYLEPLEDRCLLTAYTVTTTRDLLGDTTVGEVTLRDVLTAISTQAPSGNAPAGTAGNSISFAIGARGTAQTINVGSGNVAAALPAIAHQAFLDGWSQGGPGYGGPPLVVLSGARAGVGASGLTLGPGSDGSTIRGFVVQQFSANGVVLNGTGGNLVAGNYVGTDVSGTAAAGNASDGVLLDLGATANTVGGTAAGAGNVLSGNSYGLEIRGPGTSGNVVLGNRVGTDRSGTAALGNGYKGVFINGSAANTVGGTAAGAANVISGQTVLEPAYGLEIVGGGATGNVVLGNLIGTDATGTAALGNSWDGLHIGGGATANTVGGTVAGAANVISGNTYGNGVEISDTATTGNVVLGNLIGTDVTGKHALGNQNGVLLNSGATANTVGGLAAGSGNLLSGNSAVGVALDGAKGNVVLGNRIGTDPSGTAALGNTGGVYLGGQATANTVGGTAAGAGNLISGNGFEGVGFDGPGTSGNVVLGNLIGTDVTGKHALGNRGDGVSFSAYASGEIIGGTAPGAGNVIAANGGNGIGLVGLSSANAVLGNLIGTDVTGTVPLGNAQDGIVIGNNGNTVGGTVAGAGNVIAANGGNGVRVSSNSATGNVVLGNWIGTGPTGAADLGNAHDGVLLESGAAGNTVGGTAAGAGNAIAFNAKGVVVTNNASTGDQVAGNSIWGNAGPGIDLGDDGPTPNGANPRAFPDHGQNAPVLTAAAGGQVSGTLSSTAATTFRLDFFASPPGRLPIPGRTYLGSLDVTTGADGTTSFTAAVATPAGSEETATATNLSTGDTSEFSTALDAPASTVTAPAAVNATTFTVSWGGSDGPYGSGLASFQVYVSDDGGAYTLFRQSTAAGSAPYTGQDAHTYAFYSIATDNAGDVEPTPPAAEATTLVDLDAPTSSVAALPAFTNSASFPVSWGGSDGDRGSGIATYRVYVSDNGGAYALWHQSAAAGSATYAGQDGHTYAFYSVATDKAGNTQPTTGGAQATTLVDLDAPTSSVAALPADNLSATISVSWGGQDNAGGSGIATYQVYVSDDGGPFALWQPATTATGADYAGLFGHTYGFASVATDNAGNRQAGPVAAQATTYTAEFVDAFDRTGTTLGPAWSPLRGTLATRGGRAVVTSAPALAVYNSDDLSSSGVQASVSLPAAGTQYAGLVANYDVASRSYYLGEVVGNSGKLTAYLFRYVNGTPTSFGTLTALGAAASLAGGSGTLRLEAVGASVKLFLNGQLLAYAFDAAPLRPGLRGLWASAAATLGNFVGGPIGLNPVALPFGDAFARPDGSSLSRSWVERAGNFSVQSGKLRGNAAASLATLNESPAADVAAQADLALSATAPQYAGVVVRYGGPGASNFYLGEVVGNAGKFTAYLFRNVGGSFTALGTPVPVAVGSGTLLLQAAGSSLKLFFNGGLIIHAFDTALTAGSAGVWAGPGATLDNFAAAASTTPVTQLPFADTFSQPDGSQLRATWTEQSGNFAAKSGQLRANDPGVNLATVNLSPAVADVAVQAFLQLGSSGSQNAGLVGRYSGAGDGNEYLGEVVGNNGVFTAYVFRHLGTTWTLLSSKALTGGTGLLGFTIKGSHLQLLWDNQVVCDVTDGALTGPGLAGLRGGPGALFGDFSLAAP